MSRNRRDLRAEAETWRRRADEEARWGSEELAALRRREYAEHAIRLDHAADTAEARERRERHAPDR